MATSIIKHPISDREELAILEDRNYTYSFGVYSDYGVEEGISLLALIPTNMRLRENYEYEDDDQHTKNLNQYFKHFALTTQANGGVLDILKRTDSSEFYVAGNNSTNVRVKGIHIKNMGLVMIRLFVYINNTRTTWNQINNKMVHYTPYVGNIGIEIDIDGFLRLISGQGNG